MINDEFIPMTVHQMKLAKEPFEKILNRKKIIESRLFDEKRQLIRVGDEIEFSQINKLKNKIIVRVLGLHIYNSFDELFSNFLPQHFGGTSKKILLEKINQIYSKEDQLKYRVVGISLELKR